jgi:CDP-glycerol glycerophosphotransferase
VLCTVPDFDDTGLALVEEMIGRVDRIVWLTNDEPYVTTLDRAPEGVRVLRHRSLCGLWAFLRSDHVFFTHGLYGSSWPPPTQTVVNVWHGMPIKKIGIPDGRRRIGATYAVATSPVFREILAETWAMDPSKVLVTGQPRTDRLLRADKSEIRKKALDSLSVAASLLVWLPTYRQSDHGDVRTDGLEVGSLFGIPGVDVDDLNTRLADMHAVLFIKPHPMSITRHLSLPALSHIIRIDERWLTRCGLTLYELLGASDGLITDYSSVWIDYLLLDRPLLFAFADMTEYEETRGFVFDSVESILPGPVVATYQDLVDELERVVVGVDSCVSQRGEIRRRFHTFQDDLSTRRLLDAVGLGPDHEGASSL